jgi:fatty acid desaturase
MMDAAAPAQTYEPLRRGLLDEAELREAQRLQPWRAAVHVALLWLQIVLAWAVVARYTTWWTVLLAVPFIGTRYYALFIIGHDGLHRRLCHSVALNDLWNDLLLLGPIGAVTRLNRHNHIEHHRRAATPADPDRYKYLRANRAGGLNFALSLTGLLFVWRAVGNVFGVTAARTPDARGGYRLRDVAILAGWQLALLAGLSAAIGWWAYFVLWWMPVYGFTFAADITRVYCEHATLGSEADADRSMRLVSFRSNWLERQFFAPMGMNHHAAHHLWPGIPCYRLRQTEARLAGRALAQAIEWRGSYVAFLLAAWRASLHDASAAGIEGRP